MNSRANDFARLQGCVALLCAAIGATAPALAQTDDPADKEEASEAEEDADEENEEAATSPKPEAGAGDDAAVAGAAEPVPAAAAKDQSERQGAVALVGVEHLPSSAYPEPQVRGIEGGSLAADMHGLQWPYMPAIGGDPDVRIGFSGSAWVDTSYRKVDAGLHPVDVNLQQWLQQSRFVLRGTPTYNAPDDWFVQAQGELVANGDQTNPDPTELVETDDLYVRGGKWDLFDVTAGRFQGWEIYHLGMGLDLNTFERRGAASLRNIPPGIYGVTHFWDRPNGSGNLAIHAYPTDFLRFELLGQLGNVGGFNSLAVRPVAILDLGIVKVKAGGEYGKQTRQEQAPEFPDSVEPRGAGGSVQVVLAPYAELGASVAHSLIDRINSMGGLDRGLSTTTTSYGGFANARVIPNLVVGGGVNQTKLETLDTDLQTHLQAFGAVQYALFGQLYLKAVVAYASGHFDPRSQQMPVPFTNTMLSGRLRVLYAF